MSSFLCETICLLLHQICYKTGKLWKREIILGIWDVKVHKEWPLRAHVRAGRLHTQHYSGCSAQIPVQKQRLRAAFDGFHGEIKAAGKRASRAGWRFLNLPVFCYFSCHLSTSLMLCAVKAPMKTWMLLGPQWGWERCQLCSCSCPELCAGVRGNVQNWRQRWHLGLVKSGGRYPEQQPSRPSAVLRLPGSSLTERPESLCLGQEPAFWNTYKSCAWSHETNQRSHVTFHNLKPWG